MMTCMADSDTRGHFGIAVLYPLGSHECPQWDRCYCGENRKRSSFAGFGGGYCEFIWPNSDASILKEMDEAGIMELWSAECGSGGLH